jgi:hypothetical protein
MNPLLSIELGALHQADLAAEAARSRGAPAPDRPGRSVPARRRRLAALVAIAALHIHRPRPVRT